MPDIENVLPGEPEFEFPDHCADCPLQCNLKREFVLDFGAYQMLKAIGERQMDPEAREKLEEAAREMLGMSDEEIADQYVVFGKRVSAQIDELEGQLEQAAQTSNALAISCDGVLKMRASKADKTYTVAVCTSASENVLEAERWNHADVHMKVTTRTDNS